MNQGYVKLYYGDAEKRKDFDERADDRLRRESRRENVSCRMELLRLMGDYNPCRGHIDELDAKIRILCDRYGKARVGMILALSVLNDIAASDADDDPYAESEIATRAGKKISVRDWAKGVKKTSGPDDNIASLSTRRLAPGNKSFSDDPSPDFESTGLKEENFSKCVCALVLAFAGLDNRRTEKSGMVFVEIPAEAYEMNERSRIECIKLPLRGRHIDGDWKVAVNRLMTVEPVYERNEGEASSFEAVSKGRRRVADGNSENAENAITATKTGETKIIGYRVSAKAGKKFDAVNNAGQIETMTVSQLENMLYHMSGDDYRPLTVDALPTPNEMKLLNKYFATQEGNTAGLLYDGVDVDDDIDASREHLMNELARVFGDEREDARLESVTRVFAASGLNGTITSEDREKLAERVITEWSAARNARWLETVSIFNQSFR